MTLWRTQLVRGTAAALHDRALPDPPERVAWVCEPAEPALVLGSAQPARHVDEVAASRAGVVVVRRHSGGGAVLLVPGAVLWVDVVVPAGDPLWREDVGGAFHWLGDTWVEALEEVGVSGAVVHRGGMVRSAWSSVICFAGLGPGEVTVNGGKLVGMSQRRTREAARFQCAVYSRWDASLLRSLLADPAPTLAEIEEMCTTISADLDAVAAALLAALSRR
ncbi:MAG TPA: hypothetical protein VF855_03775 [Acidimicrobiales bacterium]